MTQSLGNKSYISKFYMFCSSLIVGGDQNSEQNFEVEHFTEMEYTCIKKKYGTKLILV